MAASLNNITFLASYFPNQEWSLPDSLIYYITKNPSSPKCYEKMIQSCKHFFIKNPILIVQRLDLLKNKENELKALFNDKPVDFCHLKSKIWITETLFINNGTKIEYTFFPTILEKIYKSDIKNLTIYNQNILLNDFKFLASKCEMIRFAGVTVMDENVGIVELEKVVEGLPSIQQFTYYLEDNGSQIITTKTVPKLLKISHFSNIESIYLSSIPESFDIESFYDFIKKNKKTRIWLVFCDEISDGYKVRIQKIVDEIIENQNRDFKVPFILFPDIIRSSINRLWEFFNDF